jgi:hypothetical protein
MGYRRFVSTDIVRGGDGGSTEASPVLIHVWTLSLEGPGALPDPLALAAINRVTDALAPFLTDLQAALSTACETPVVLRAEG